MKVLPRLGALTLALGLSNLTPVHALPIGHNPLDPQYRQPVQAAAAGQGNLVLRLALKAQEASAVRVRILDEALQKTWWQSLKPESEGDQQIWTASLLVPSQPTLLYYWFEIQTKGSIRYYQARSDSFRHGGFGDFGSSLAPHNGFRVSVYDPSFGVANWLKGAVIYQIFPDRFRNGDLSNDPIDHQSLGYGELVRRLNWSEPLCDPRGSLCPGESENQFYGGDLQGVIDKLDYLQGLGVDVIYLNPIFTAATNHRYDTKDYFSLDPSLGNLEIFKRLIDQAHARGMKVLLDGVFNHSSSENPFFAEACASAASPYRQWYFFPAFGLPARLRSGEIVACAGNLAQESSSYEAFFGVANLPRFNAKTSGVRKYLFEEGASSVGPYWIAQGADGWRLDVGVDVDLSLVKDPTNGFWSGFRKAIHAVNPESIALGEAMGDATPWLLGREWDSAMNYRFRSAALGWLFDDCSGYGCSNGEVFATGESNAKTLLGSIEKLTDSQFALKLASIQQDYPQESWLSMMNLVGSHDTSRVLYLLKQLSKGSDAIARQKLRLLLLFQFTYPGAPAIYYGDEAGLADEDHWDGDQWQSDPYSRAVYPWPDQGYSRDESLISYVQEMSKLHHAYDVFKDGAYETLKVDDANRVFAFRRFKKAQNAVVVFNRSMKDQGIVLPVASFAADGTRFHGPLSGQTFVVQNGVLKVTSVSALSGEVLVELRP